MYANVSAIQCQAFVILQNNVNIMSHGTAIIWRQCDIDESEVSGIQDVC